MSVIDDFEVNNSDTSLKKERKASSPRQKAVRVLVFWILFLGIAFAVSISPVSKALAQTDFLERITHITASRRAGRTVSLKVWFVRTTDGRSFSIKGFPATVVGTGIDTSHDVVECLIDGTSTEAAKAGYISLFPSDTKLNGLTVSCGCAFVDLSSEFLSVEKTWGTDGVGAAAMQIKLSLQRTGLDVDEVVILIDGVETYCF